jgi:hypothetical protein
LGDLEIDKRIILKCILNNVCRCGLESSVSGYFTVSFSMLSLSSLFPSEGMTPDLSNFMFLSINHLFMELFA